MLCTEQASAVLLLALMGSRAAGVGAAWQEPFQLGVSVLGTNCLFLAGIIRSSIAYADTKQYVARNVIFFITASATIAASNMLGFSALANTALTYGVLWASSKLAELVPAGDLVVLFVASLMMWFASLFLMNIYTMVSLDV
ncbi:hypothetical protein COO60DRAFT_50661 [Scenedesmus sp. NREL 46B-D3]|nr:hypothetical protein COO60DRAFT_50661 [Scenedesmus sp. NREL 46B-D3]